MSVCNTLSSSLYKIDLRQCCIYVLLAVADTVRSLARHIKVFWSKCSCHMEDWMLFVYTLIRFVLLFFSAIPSFLVYLRVFLQLVFCSEMAKRCQRFWCGAGVHIKSRKQKENKPKKKIKEKRVIVYMVNK